MQSLKNCKNVIEQSASRLMRNSAESATNIFSIDDVLLNSSVVIDMSSKEEKSVVIFNPSTNQRSEVVSLKVSSPYLEIYDGDGSKIEEYQLSLVWDNSDILSINEDEMPTKPDERKQKSPLDFDQSTFELLFQIDINPLSMKTIRIKPVDKNDKLLQKFSKVKLFVQNSSDFEQSQTSLAQK